MIVCSKTIDESLLASTICLSNVIILTNELTGFDQQDGILDML